MCYGWTYSSLWFQCLDHCDTQEHSQIFLSYIKTYVIFSSFHNETTRVNTSFVLLFFWLFHIWFPFSYWKRNLRMHSTSFITFLMTSNFLLILSLVRNVFLFFCCCFSWGLLTMWSDCFILGTWLIYPWIWICLFIYILAFIFGS